jgi:hypothetical protein
MVRPKSITEIYLNDVMESADLAYALPVSQGGSVKVAHASTDLCCEAGALLAHIENAEIALAVAVEESEKFLNTESAKAARAGRFALATHFRGATE